MCRNVQIINLRPSLVKASTHLNFRTAPQMKNGSNFFLPTSQKIDTFIDFVLIRSPGSLVRPLVRPSGISSLLLGFQDKNRAESHYCSCPTARYCFCCVYDFILILSSSALRGKFQFSPLENLDFRLNADMLNVTFILR